MLAGRSTILSHHGHHSHEIPAKYATTHEHRRLGLLRARVQAPVSVLEVLRSARHSLLPQTLSL
jgi:hypothetical protein